MHILFLFVFMYITQGKCSIAFPFVSLKRVIFFFNFLMFSCHNDYCLLLLLMQNSNCFENVCDWFCGNIVNFRLRKKKKKTHTHHPQKKNIGGLSFWFEIQIITSRLLPCFSLYSTLFPV